MPYFRKVENNVPMCLTCKYTNTNTHIQFGSNLQILLERPCLFIRPSDFLRAKCKINETIPNETVRHIQRAKAGLKSGPKCPRLLAGLRNVNFFTQINSFQINYSKKKGVNHIGFSTQNAWDVQRR